MTFLEKLSNMSRYWRGKGVVVTGGAGFIGKLVVSMLEHLGANVTVIDPRSHSRSSNYVPVPLERLGLLNSLIDDNDIVIHMAASVAGIQVNSKSHAAMFQKNLIPGLSVLDACANAEKKCLIVSSACVYPEGFEMSEAFGDHGKAEKSNAGYGTAKRMIEQYAAWLADEAGLRYSVVRPFNAYGPGDNFDPANSHVIPGLIRRIDDANKELTIWGTGSQVRSFLYCDDFAEGVVLAAEKLPDGAVVNLGSDESVTMTGLANLISHAMGKELFYSYDNTKPNGHENRVAVVDKAKELIGFEAKTPLRDGLRRTVEWYKAKVKPMLVGGY